MSEYKGISSTDESLKGDETEFLGVLSSWHEAAKKNRQQMDWNWYLYDNYYRGNHYIQFNKRTNQIVTPPRPKGQVRLTVNKIYSICRAIRNFATSYRPKWEVAANSTGEDVINNAQKSSDTLDYYYDYLELPKLIKGVANYIIKYGIGFFQYGWDEEGTGLDNQKGEVDVWIRDPFDVYLDPSGMETGDIQNCRFIDIAVSQPIQDIIDSPAYKKIKEDEISGDTIRAVSEFKQSLIQNQYTGDFASNKELKTKILHETLYKKKVGSNTEVWIASWIEGHLLRNEKTEFNKYNLIAIASDDNPNEIYGEGYIKNLIPINKVINRLESQVVEYNNLVNRGRLIVDKDSGVSKITNETGEIIEKNPGADVREISHAGLSPDIHIQIGRLDEDMKSISGVVDAFLGKVPEGVKSGVALESLKAQTANNLQDLKDNIEAGLAQLGEGILELIATKVVASRQIKATGKDGEPANFSIKGQVGVNKGEQLPEDTYVIGNQNQVKVVIGSGLAYTREGRITRLDKLLEQKVIGPEAYLRGIEFGDVEETIKEAQQAKFNDQMMESVTSQQGQPQGAMPPAGQSPMGQQPQPAEQGPDSWSKLADDENKAMLTGKIIPPTEGAPKEHTAVHIAWSQSDEVQENEHLMKAVYEHIKGEEEAAGMNAGGQLE